MTTIVCDCCRKPIREKPVRVRAGLFSSREINQGFTGAGIGVVTLPATQMKLTVYEVRESVSGDVDLCPTCMSRLSAALLEAHNRVFDEAEKQWGKD